MKIKILATGGTIAGSANKTVKQVVKELKLFDDAEIDKLFDTLMMTDSARSGKIFSGERT